ncbi:hypothetical protein EDWATA_00200 [Edwardsiella tarda ATCC 23685]|uniref:Uncharacterized protein n=1 Tax=Edwardsiella tarda ATCC 23685 TaxID=500638 RepID=D4F0H7_EDWTA|nr:hypothetical protein EDWATA_00200 [Edwardsiella tarda ATCC 23685]
MLWQLTQNSVVLVILMPTCGRMINARPMTMPSTSNASTDQRVLGRFSLFQSFFIAISCHDEEERVMRDLID